MKTSPDPHKKLTSLMSNRIVSRWRKSKLLKKWLTKLIKSQRNKFRPETTKLRHNKTHRAKIWKHKSRSISNMNKNNRRTTPNKSKLVHCGKKS